MPQLERDTEQVQTKHRLLEMARIQNQINVLQNHNRGGNGRPSLRCIQINLQHSRAATDNLTQLVETQYIDIAFIQEPHIINNKIAGIPSRYRTYYSGQGKKRAAIVIINNQIDAVLIHQLSEEDSVVIEIIHENLKFLAASMYLDINHEIENDLKKVDKVIEYSKTQGILIAMDSNARSKTWYDHITNTRGNILEEYLLGQNLHIMNEYQESTTFESTRGSSNIDLTLTNNKLVSLLNNWNISEVESCSDHNIISYDIGQANPNYKQSDILRIRYIVKEDNYRAFTENIAREITHRYHWDENTEHKQLDEMLRIQVTEEADVERSVNEINEALRAACKKSFKTVKTSQKNGSNKTVPWWTDVLKIMRKKVNAMRRRYQKTTADEELRGNRKNQYLEEKRKYQGAIRKAKLDSWKKFCSVSGSTNPWNEVYRIASGKLRKNAIMTTLRKPDDTLTTDLDDTIRNMLNYFTPTDDERDDNAHHKQVRRESQEPIETCDDKDFTKEEIRATLEDMDYTKSPGEDGITSKILLQVTEIIPKSITAIYNACLKRGIFPKQWKRARIIPIVKPGKEDSLELTKFRPICLLNTGGKVLEKLMIKRIMHHMNKNDLMNKNQFGFTPQTSTIDAAMAVKQFVEKNINEKKSIILVSLDVKGAFDAAWWPSILKLLRDSKCPRNLYNLSISYFSQRTAFMSMNNNTIERDVSKGCPQGSCCGPGYWNILYNSLLNIKFTKFTKAIAFADDLILITQGSTTPEAENYANIELHKVTTWAKNNKMEFHEQKSKVMLITRKKGENGNGIRIYLNNKELELVNSIKYLGIVLDKKFSFNEHIEYVTNKCTKLIHTLSKSAKISWGLSHEALTTIYKGAILPLLMYGAPIWIKALQKEANKKKYKRIQRLINIKMAKAFRTVSYDALCILTGQTPIVLKINEAVELYNIKKTGKFGDNLIDTMVNYKTWPHPADSVLIRTVTENMKHDLTIYTDGSKTEHGVGSGIVIYTDQESTELKYRLDGRCSNNQAEQLAIMKGLQYIEEIELKGQERIAAIYTDSKITLDSLKNHNNHNYLIERIREKLKDLKMAKWTIEFSWVKAHAGIHGNEVADRLAKQAGQDIGLPLSFSKIPVSVVQSELHQQSQQKWEREWENSTKGEITKSYFPSVKDRLRTKTTLTPNLTTLLTGHGRLRSYYHRFKITNNPMCSCNQEEETVKHVIYKCKKFSKERKLLIESVTKCGKAWPVTQKCLISNFKGAFLTFVKCIELENI